MLDETNRMILATKQLFYAMQAHKVMEFRNVDFAATMFAHLVHANMDMKHAVLTIVTLIYILMTLCSFGTLMAPACVLTTLFRMPNQMAGQYIHIVSMIGITIYYGYILLSHKTPNKYTVVCTILCVLCTACEIVQNCRIKSAKAVISKTDYTADLTIHNKTLDYTREDRVEQAKMTQCMVYTPDSEKNDVCLIHLNYGGWQVQDQSAGEYLKLPGLDHAFDLSGSSPQNQRVLKEINQWMNYFANEEHETRNQGYQQQ